MYLVDEFNHLDAGEIQSELNRLYKAGYELFCIDNRGYYIFVLREEAKTLEL